MRWRRSSSQLSISIAFTASSTLTRSIPAWISQTDAAERFRGAWPIARRLHHQTPCAVRRKRPPSRLRPDTRPGARYPRLRPAVSNDRRPYRGAPGGQGLCPTPSAKRSPRPVSRRSSPPKATAALHPHDREKYRWRNLVERLFNKLKNWRRIATRYDKTKESYLGLVALASIKLWLPFVHEA